MQLVDYKVRVINSEAGTAAGVRVIIESRDEHDVWGTVGVSENVIEASWLALVDASSTSCTRTKSTSDRRTCRSSRPSKSTGAFASCHRAKPRLQTHPNDDGRMKSLHRGFVCHSLTHASIRA